MVGGQVDFYAAVENVLDLQKTKTCNITIF